MRWDRQALAIEDGEALPGLGRLAGLVRSVRTPEFAGVTFHEVNSKSALNRIGAKSPMPFPWSVNPYRGCTHGCVYCFARGTHSYLEFDTGHDFDTQIVVKINIAEVLRRELARPGWLREHVAMGTNTDPYQRAEGRYQLMPGVVRALAGSGTPFSILTKGTVLSRDLPLLAALQEDVPVGLGVSLALLDPDLQARLEPGTPSPKARLDLIRRITGAGLPCGVLVAPVLPHLTDRPEQLRELVGQLKQAGVTGVSAVTLHLRPGAREWFFPWLARVHPELVGVYERLYARGANAASDYRRMLSARFAGIREEFGLGSQDPPGTRGIPGATDASFPAGSMPTPREPEQETLF
ncbi:DNA repair photolyase [Nakamurella panacisegetis]|uniref:DNA repair photolyase n=1 Tax=Nakamurella panacisegetis TaxID=1090615 RepID=A0A1H0QW26_9ACTN|nr:Rv2578c family radical SAM protein [Nakamurella panacisegetis]SDP21493.1 DNA repair photolyase [Nakamurella panacisegetis]